MIPGELFAEPGEIELNAGRPTVTVTVEGVPARPVESVGTARRT